MTQYIAIPAEYDQGCEGCCFNGNILIDWVEHSRCIRPDSVPHCQQTDDKGNVKEFIYEVKP